MKTSASNVESIYPLSPAQQGMLFHSVATRESGMYVSQLTLELEGAFDVSAFQAAWSRLVHRHSVLRSAFVWEDLDEPMQVVARELKLSWREEDWRQYPRQERLRRLEALAQREGQRDFELKKPPLMRLVLVRLEDDFYHFVWSFHHLLLDGWSMALALNEVFETYRGGVPGSDVGEGEPKPYEAYIAWLRKQDLKAAQTFWKGHLKGFRALTPLPGELASPGGPAERTEADAVSLSLPSRDTERLEELVRAHRITTNTLVQGAWALLLSRWSGERDLVYGSVVSGRPSELPGVEAMVGMFINTLPVRVTVDPHEGLLPWLRRLQDSLSEQRGYEFSSLVKIREWSDLPADSPVFESLVMFESHLGEISLAELGGGLQARQVSNEEVTNYPLMVVAGSGRELFLELRFDRLRFRESHVRRLLFHLADLLRSMGRDPSRRLRKLEMLTAGERQQLLRERNDTARSDAPPICAHRAFRQQATYRPGAEALVVGEESLSYGTLLRRVDRLARVLRRRGVKPETVVGLNLPPGAEMVVSLLAILEAGGCYLPLDPSFPESNLCFKLVSSGARYLLCDGRRVEGFEGEVLDVGALEAEAVEEGEGRLLGGADLGNLAYVIFTSGSTGEPKGVQVEHRSLACFLRSMARTPGFCTEDRLLCVTTLSFDISALEILLPLSVGGCVILATPEERTDGRLLARRIRSSGATVMQATPSTWRLLLDADWAPSRDIKVLSGGEALSAALARELLRGGGEVWNLYGPTETTIWSSVTRVEAAEKITIGRPIDDTQIHVLDRVGDLAPLGGVGELCIGGIGVSRGYRLRPALTAERFVPDPFSPSRGTRLYRTGDLARGGPAGGLECLGRLDHQIKLRGFRIEPGEIETVLEGLDGVATAVVSLRDEQLVAYWVPEQGSEADRASVSSRLRGDLEERLPRYMVPAVYVELESLPLTPNGKVDRKALPDPGELRTELEAANALPTTPTEIAVAEIWKKVLRLESIHLGDNFFELGGHSLVANLVIADIHRELGVDLPVNFLFMKPKLGELALAVTEKMLEEASELEVAEVIEQIENLS